MVYVHEWEYLVRTIEYKVNRNKTGSVSILIIMFTNKQRMLLLRLVFSFFFLFAKSLFIICWANIFCPCAAVWSGVWVYVVTRGYARRAQ